MLPLIKGKTGKTPAKRSNGTDTRKPLRGLSPSWYARIQGNVIEVCQAFPYQQSKPEVNRSTIGMWTRQSRMRMLRLLNQVDWPGIHGTQFVTVTYPDAIDHRAYEDRSKDRFKLLRYIEKAQRQHTPSIWRCEWKERQSGQFKGTLFPHFHYALLGSSPIDVGELRGMWAKTIGYRHINLQVDSQQIYGIEGALKYLAKYVSKSESLDIGTYHNNYVKFGRHWGITRKEKIPMCPITICRALTEAETQEMRAMGAERMASYNVDLSGSFTILDQDSARYWADHLNASGQPSQGRLY